MALGFTLIRAHILGASGLCAHWRLPIWDLVGLSLGQGLGEKVGDSEEGELLRGKQSCPALWLCLGKPLKQAEDLRNLRL